MGCTRELRPVGGEQSDRNKYLPTNVTSISSAAEPTGTGVHLWCSVLTKTTSSIHLQVFKIQSLTETRYSVTVFIAYNNGISFEKLEVFKFIFGKLPFIPSWLIKLWKIPGFLFVILYKKI